MVPEFTFLAFYAPKFSSASECNPLVVIVCFMYLSQMIHLMNLSEMSHMA